VLSWFRFVQNAEAPAQYNEYRDRVAAGLTAADLVVAPTAAMRHAVSVHYDVHTECVVIPNARSPRLFSPAEKSSELFACGRIWDEAKNLRLLAGVAQQIKWPITIAGDCREPGGRTTVLRNVRCLGKISAAEMALHFSHSAIFVLPARYEPFGLSALEAGLSGCALILGDIPSLREIWNESAIFVSPQDPVALTNAVNGLIDDPRLRRELGRRARVRALEFSPHRMATEYAAAYHHCLFSWRCRDRITSPAEQGASLSFEEVAV
jgi:glycogen(starch) synthase